MKKLGAVLILSLVSAHAVSQKNDLNEKSQQLIGNYSYCGTFDSQWMMMDDSDSLSHDNFLFRTCYHLYIAKINSKEGKYIAEHQDSLLSKSNIFRGLKIFIGCKGGDQYLYATRSDNLLIGDSYVRFKDEDLGAIGHFIYFGLEVDHKLFWYKFLKQ